jgi:signal transduction histidine kinase
MYGFLKYVNQQDYKNKTKAYLVAASVIAVSLICDLTRILDIKYFNLWITAPLLVFSLCLFSGYSFYLFLKKEKLSIGIFCAGFIALAVSVGSDFLFRIGLIDGGVVSSNLAVLALFVITASTYTAYAFEAKNTISQHNETLKKSLKELQMELEGEFEKMSKLRQESALSKQMTHLSRELHDGILNYMSMIFALSENKKSEDMEVINRLSKLALSEIRIIINSTESGNQTLFSVLSVLRSQLIEPIEMMGIKVEWSLLDLIDLPKVEPKVMLEVVRVFQEAIHNAVSRAKCTTLVVSGTVDQNGDIKVLIKNYGGTSLDLDKNIGSGIAGMLSRAKRISARITLTPVEGGAELELILPKLVFTASQ